MHRESIYRRYKPEFTPNKENNGNAYWFLFNSNELLVEMGKIPEIPYTKSLEELKINPIRLQYLGTFNGHPCYSGELPSEIQVPRGMAFKDLRSLYDIIEEDLYLLAGRASQIVNWDRSHQFCGQCGAPTITKDDEMAKLCPECGFTVSPAYHPQ